MPTAPHGLSPLSDEEAQELEDFLMEDRDGSEAMMSSACTPTGFPCA